MYFKERLIVLIERPRDQQQAKGRIYAPIALTEKAHDGQLFNMSLIRLNFLLYHFSEIATFDART